MKWALGVGFRDSICVRDTTMVVDDGMHRIA